MGTKGFTKDANRVDPYKNFKFLLRDANNNTVLGVSKVSALKRTTEVVKHREGGDPSTSHKSPGRTEYDAITLERGITHDREFEIWANRVHRYGTDAHMVIDGYKQNFTLEVMNERGQPVVKYFLLDCWVSEYTTLPELDANANAVAVESIKLEIAGWRRDGDTNEPEPTGDVPNTG